MLNLLDVVPLVAGTKTARDMAGVVFPGGALGQSFSTVQKMELTLLLDAVCLNLPIGFMSSRLFVFFRCVLTLF
jgi:hypothetical protein